MFNWHKQILFLCWLYNTTTNRVAQVLYYLALFSDYYDNYIHQYIRTTIYCQYATLLLDLYFKACNFLIHLSSYDHISFFFLSWLIVQLITFDSKERRQFPLMIWINVACSSGRVDALMADSCMLS